MNRVRDMRSAFATVLEEGAGNVVALPLDIDSEDDLAQAFEREASDRARFCHTNRGWYWWDERRWALDTTCKVQHTLRTIAQRAKGPKIKKSSAINGAATLASTNPELAVQLKDFDRDPFLIGTPGGTVDLRTGQIREALQHDLITRLTAVAPADPGSVPERWLAFLHEATRGDVGLIRFLQQIVGYALTGDTREHALFFIYGDGGNGKSVFLNTIIKLLRDYVRTAAMDTFTAAKYERHPTDLAMLAGARLVSASETEDGRAFAEARIKQMTGGDPIAARFMGKDFFEYVPEFKLILIGNHKPRLHNVDAAVKRRFNIIPFVHKPANVDHELEAKLHEEWPAILRWAIDGCLDWQANGLVRPQIVVDATNEYFDDQNVLAQWIDECCECDPRYRELHGPLFASWKRYAGAQGEDSGTSSSFKERMCKAGFEPKKSGGFSGFLGIRVAPQPAPTDGQFAKDWQ